MKVVVQCDDVVKFFEGVTKVQTFLHFDMFENEIIIHQGKKKTKLKQWEINGFEVKENEVN